MIELKNIRKVYGSNLVLRDVNLAVKEGDFISIRGRSGVGKTTLLRIIGLLDSADMGEVKIFGLTTSKLSDEEKSRIRLYGIGFIFQFFNLIPSLTVFENVELPLALAGMDKKERRFRVRELLEYFGIMGLAERFPETLSGGERQRVAVIRAIANSPKLILADEPTSSLDSENSGILMDLLSRINRERRTTIILTTTDLYEKLPTNRDYILKDGNLYQEPT